MQEPVWQPRARFEALRAERGFAAKAGGLWCCGDLEPLRRPCVAIVGTRAATAYGKRVARELAARLSEAGCCILSGLALGIDTAAHEGALDATAATIGVLGGGHSHFFPRSNVRLAARMLAAGGAVLSPFAPSERAMPAQFLQRNGVVAALADAVVVVEAPARSGALNTAGWAAGRIPVLAVPGDVDRRHVAGCLSLIRDGAMLARNAGDVLEALGLHSRQTLLAAPAAAADPAEQSLLAALDAGALGVEHLAAATQLPAAAILAALTRLELNGLVERRGADEFARL
ncbi:MAG TPA: DNA-processing protein DprA [Candidatus Acidoferrales bacterium]|nr:DNA-processing protein DprA [Candidatus Acidoferrales bacterium]